MYNIVLTKSAVKDLKSLDKNEQKNIADKIALLKENPKEHSKKLINHSIGEYRLRVGNYRVIFDISTNDVVILKIEHRKDIYN